jgi:carbamoyl-phosphate synthase large subunit
MNNIDGIENEPCIGNYEEGVLMLMYDDVVITTEKELLRDYHD